MRIALVQCPFHYSQTVSCALSCLSAYLRSKNHDVYAFDFNILYQHIFGEEPIRRKYPLFFTSIYRLENFKIDKKRDDFLDLCAEKIMNSGADVIGFSISVLNVENSIALARKIKQRDRKKSIIFGGPDCSRNIRALEYIKLDCVDFVVCGEGEETLNEIFADLKRGIRKKSYRGTLSKYRGRIIDSVDERLVDMDKLPYPDFSDFDMKLYPESCKILPVEFSRGCTGKCIFCRERSFWKVYRCKTGKRMGKEIQYLVKKYNIENFRFTDSAINNNVKELNNFCDYVIKKRIKISWDSFARINGMNYELLKKMKEAGCSCLTFGLESGSQKVVNLMEKGFELHKTEKIIKHANKIGIEVTTTYIIGFPTETFLDFLKTLKFVWRMRKYVYMVPSFFFTPCKGTDIHKNYKKYNMVSTNNLWRTKFYTNTIISRIFRYYLFTIMIELLKKNWKKVRNDWINVELQQ